MSLPLGWTMDPKELDYEDDWATSDGRGCRLAVEYNLGKCRPIMRIPELGEVMFEGRWEILSNLPDGWRSVSDYCPRHAR
jgi:hypothetical protein